MPKILFKKLPVTTLNRLKERLENDETVIFPAQHNWSNYALISIGIAWLVVLFLLSDSFQWSRPKTVILGFLTITLLYLAIRSMLAVVRERAGIPSQIFVTPNYVIETGHDTVEYDAIDQLVAVDYQHNYQNRQYESSNVHLSFKNREKTIKLTDLSRAEEAVDRIGHFKKLFIEASVRGDQDYLSAADDFEGVSAEDDAGKSFSNVLFRHALPMAISLVISAGGMFVAITLNEYFDDKRSWELAVAGDKASSYRQYIQTHPAGRWFSESKGRLTAFYDAAEAKYLSSIGENHDKDAVAAMSSLLRYARETHNYQILVSFERKADIPADIIEQLKKDFEVDKVLPLGDTFTDEKIIGRETRIFAILSDAFGHVFAGDVLELTTQCSGNCSTFIAKYETSFLNSIYYDVQEKHLPERERSWSPGLLIEWNFVLQIPDGAHPYEFSLESAPANTISYDPPTDEIVSPDTNEAVRELNQASFYDAMVASAFNDFKEHLLFNLGVGPEPKDQVETEESKPETTKPKPNRIQN